MALEKLSLSKSKTFTDQKLVFCHRKIKVQIWNNYYFIKIIAVLTRTVKNALPESNERKSGQTRAHADF